MGDVRKLWIEGPAGRLEAALRVAAQPVCAAVLAHPHPLHGGTLHNPVMFHSDRALHRAGFTTLRFNFRGVGASDGDHDGGRGEVEDLAACVSWLRGIAGGAPLVVVAYSFGSWCALRYAAREPSLRGVVGIGIPVRTYDFAGVFEALRVPVGAVHGSEDDLAPLDDLRAHLARAKPPARLRVVEGASHLFPGRAPDAAAAVRDVSLEVLSGDA
jgi:alpha/beta superfamily hydrolase